MLTHLLSAGVNDGWRAGPTGDRMTSLIACYPLSPQSADGSGRESLPQLECLGSGVKQDSVDEAVPKPVSEPREMAGGAAVGAGIGFYLESEDVSLSLIHISAPTRRT